MSNAPAMTMQMPGPEVDPMVGHVQESFRLERRTWLLLGVGIVPAALWLTLAPLASAVVSPGHVKVDQNRHTVQHAEGGTVRAVFVRDGQQVKAGQPLMELGDVAVSADKNRLSYRLLSEKASAVRLEVEQARGAALVWPAYLLAAAKADPTLAEQLRKEQSLFSARRESLVSQITLLQQQRGKIEQEMGLMRTQLERAQESISAQRRELESNSSLAKDGFIPATRVMQLESSVADYGARVEERRSELVRAEQRIVDLELKVRALDNEYRQQASDQLKLAVVRVQEIEQELRKATDVSTRQVILAPADGEVMGLRVTNPGMVIAPREPVAELVPANPKLLVEARIRPEDINRVHIGQSADMRFTAYKYRTTSMVTGQVTYISADRMLEPQNQQPYYTVQVEVAAEAVAAATQGEKLQAGMPAEVYLQGEERTPLQYLIEPITQVLNKAGRER